jgi:DNA-directed RNA polymerase subunit M/transcription elongation factor TFIIS
MAKKLTNSTVLLTLMNLRKWEDDEKAIRKMVKLKEHNVEATWDILTSVIDTGSENLSLTTFITNHLKNDVAIIENLATPPENKETLPEIVNTDKLLSIDGEVGLTCPNCKLRDVKYVLIANRSGDEGMSADCECRSCNARFRLRV